MATPSGTSSDEGISHHKVAIITIFSALILDALAGVAFAAIEHIPAWHGLYWALTTAVTVGADVQPKTTGGYALTAVVCLTIVPLFAASFSLFTSGLTATHVRKGTAELKQHITDTVGSNDES